MARLVQDNALFLGLDCFTQSMSALVVDTCGQVVYESSFRFDERFPHYNTKNGALRSAENEVAIPSFMFVESLDAIMGVLAKSSVDLTKIKSISGSAQQHSSVYWSKDFSLRRCFDAVIDLDVTTMIEAMKKQQEPVFCLPNGPSWMDSSTTHYCKELEAAVGGSDRVAEISGSRPTSALQATELLREFTRTRCPRKMRAYCSGVINANVAAVWRLHFN